MLTSSSICGKIGSLLYKEMITNNEFLRLHEHFQRQKPKNNKYHIFYYHYTFTGGMYWWKLDSDGTAQRKLFVEHLSTRFWVFGYDLTLF
jgi:hypothetical protein